jgi:drug/metabolite transporter (DMT)-like permease
LSKTSPSVFSALLSLSPALIPFFAYWIVGERLSLQVILGLLIIIVGAFCYSMVDAGEFRISKALLPVFFAALCLDLVAVANKYIFTKTVFTTGYFYYMIGAIVGGIFFLILLNQSDRRTLQQLFIPNMRSF